MLHGQGIFPMKKTRQQSVLNTADRWQSLCAAARPVRWIDSFLRAYGQVLFADHPLTGLCMVAAIALVSPGALLFTALGAALASICALRIGEDRAYVRHGIFGFNGVVLGIFWSWYFTVSLPSVAVFSVMALLIPPLQAVMMKTLSYGRYNLPVMSLPATAILIASLLVVYWLVYSAGLFPPEAVYPVIKAPQPAPETVADAGDGILRLLLNDSLPVWGLIFIGILINSRISALAALLFTTAGLGLTGLLPPLGQTAVPVFIGFNLLPLAVGLTGFFLVAGGRAFFVTGLAAIVCLLGWIALCNLLRPLNLPFLTLPFNLTVLGVLLWVRTAGPERSGIRAVPLAMITTPEEIWKAQGHPLTRPWTSAAAANIGRRLGDRFFTPRPTRGDIRHFLEMIDGARRISILSGAGTSTEAGIPDFRGNAGFWRAEAPDTFSLENFLSHPDVRNRYWSLESLFYRMIQAARPHALHRFVKRIEQSGRLEGVVTQNVDGLFQKAGIDPSRVIEVHGTASRIRCLACGAVTNRADMAPIPQDGDRSPVCPLCGGLLKPDTVFMGEMLNESVLHDALSRILASDLLVIVGTSLAVNPVASLPDLAHERGVKIVIINREPTDKDHLAARVIRCKAGLFFGKILRKMVD